jgi:aminoglycoside N3'-acetyltransferase
MKPTIQTISEQLIDIGVQYGDIILVTADLLKVGFFDKNRNETMRIWVDMLEKIVGDAGTIIAPAYTPSFLRFKKNKSLIFKNTSQTNSGAFSNALMKDSRSVRSLHPTNSYIALGRNAEEILKLHNERAMSYSVAGEIVKRNGKHLMLGTLDKQNAPLGLHYAQELLGITKKEPTVGLYQTYYFDSNGEKKLFTRRDVGGCSGGGYKMLGHLIVEGAIKIGFVGNALTGLIDASKSVHIATSVLAADQKAFICDDPTCFSCRGRWCVSGLTTPIFYAKEIYKKLK